MMVLHYGSGARDFELHDEVFKDEQWDRIKLATCDLLRSRGMVAPAIFFEGLPFSLFSATNNFGDEFCVLFAKLPMDKYVEVSGANEEMQESTYASIVAKALSEICSRYVRFVAVEPDTNPTPMPVTTPTLQVTSQSVERALADAEQLVRTRGAVSGVDRAHTAFHGYLRTVCERENIAFGKEDSMAKLLKLLRQNHPALGNLGVRSQDVERILFSFASILDALNPIRNYASVAHPNEELLGDDEAMLVINVVRTLMHYLNAKFD